MLAYAPIKGNQQLAWGLLFASDSLEKGYLHARLMHWKRLSIQMFNHRGMENIEFSPAFLSVGSVPL